MLSLLTNCSVSHDPSNATHSISHHLLTATSCCILHTAYLDRGTFLHYVIPLFLKTGFRKGVSDVPRDESA